MVREITAGTTVHSGLARQSHKRLALFSAIASMYSQIHDKM